MKMHAEELTKMGKIVSAGDRLEYVVVKTAEEIDGEEVLLGLKMRNIEMYEESLKYGKRNKYMYPREALDYEWYIQHAVMNPIDQLFNMGHRKELKFCSRIYYENKPGHKTSILTPVKMISKVIENKFVGYEGGYIARKFSALVKDVEELKTFFRRRIEELPNEIEIIKNEIIAYINYNNYVNEKIKKSKFIYDDEVDSDNQSYSSKNDETCSVKSSLSTVSTVSTKSTRSITLQSTKKISRPKLTKK